VCVCVRLWLGLVKCSRAKVGEVVESEAEDAILNTPSKHVERTCTSLHLLTRLPPRLYHTVQQ